MAAPPLQRIKDTARVPPGGYYYYTDAETGLVIRHPYFLQVRLKARAHRLANRLPIPTNWEAMFEDNVCRSTPTCPCEPVEGSVRSVWRLATRFAQAMTTWAAAGFPLVDDAALAARRLACEGGLALDGTEAPRCPQWEAHRGVFGRCGKCGCSGTLKTAIATEVCPLGRWPAIYHAP